MKKILCLLFVLEAVFFCSCEMPVGMKELLAYQEEGFTCEAMLDGEKEVELYILCADGKITVKPSGMEYLGDTEFVFSGEEAWLSSGGLKIAIDKTKLQSLYTVYEMFTLDTSKTWRITKEKLGGIDIYKCISDDFTVYIDAKTRLPLKFSGKGQMLDVKSMEIDEK